MVGVNSLQMTRKFIKRSRQIIFKNLGRLKTFKECSAARAHPQLFIIFIENVV